MFNALAPYVSMQERIDEMHKTETWQKSISEGNLAPFESMKVKKFISNKKKTSKLGLLTIN